MFTTCKQEVQREPVLAGDQRASVVWASYGRRMGVVLAPPSPSPRRAPEFFGDPVPTWRPSSPPSTPGAPHHAHRHTLFSAFRPPVRPRPARCRASDGFRQCRSRCERFSSLAPRLPPPSRARTDRQTPLIWRNAPRTSFRTAQHADSDISTRRPPPGPRPLGRSSTSISAPRGRHPGAPGGGTARPLSSEAVRRLLLPGGRVRRPPGPPNGRLLSAS